MTATLYPHLTAILASLTTALAPIPVFAHADASAVLAQVTPAVHLLPGPITVIDQQRSGRTLRGLSLSPEWEVVTLVRDASDQRDLLPALTTLGEIEATVLTAIMGGLTSTGGILTLTKVPAPKTWSGGLISGSLHFTLGWAFHPA